MNYLDYLPTPVGILKIQASDQGITRIIFTDAQPTSVNSHPLLEQCKKELMEYFVGQRYQFDIPLDQQGTAFQCSVWRRLSEIPFGDVVSYRDIATKIDNPKAVRAVGAANGKNPISIIVPCHRVVGSDGSLTGYAWGLRRKTWLLQHEAEHR